MSELVLKKLYAHVNLDFSTEVEDIAGLRKVLLLELKSSPSNMLKIDSINYSKQDILQLLEMDYSQSSMGIDGILKRYPGAVNIFKPKEIRTFLSPDISVLHPDELETIQSQINEKQLFEYRQEITASLQNLDFERTLTLLSYLGLTSTEQQMETKKAAQTVVLRLISIEKGQHKQFIFVTEPMYYMVLDAIYDHDRDFLYDQLVQSWRFLKMFTKTETKKYFSLQLELDFSEFVKVQLREQADEYYKKQPDNHRQAYIREQRRINLILIIVVFGIFLGILGLMYVMGENAL